MLAKVVKLRHGCPITRHNVEHVSRAIEVILLRFFRVLTGLVSINIEPHAVLFF